MNNSPAPSGSELALCALQTPLPAKLSVNSMPLNEHVIAEQSSQSDAGEQSAIRRALESTARPENLWRGVCAIVVCHAFIWSVAPLLTVGDLHSDTLEIVSWASQLAMGNPKHPPMATWIMHMVLALPGSRLFNLFALSQLGVAIASLFVWRSVRLYAEPPFAALAVLFFLESPAATFFALNVNHNAMLIPVAAAVVFFTLRYLENRSRKDAALLGLSTGIALLTKYEIALLVLPLLVMCVFVPRFRGAWTDARSFLAVAICAATIAPHL